MSPEPLRVLLIEDSPDDAALFERELGRSGRDLTLERVETEATLRSALAKVRWDAILCDYNLPGFGAMAALAVLQETGNDIPFIVVSGTVGEETAVEALKAGAHDFVMKDRLARLLPAISREIREAEVRRERRQAMEDLRRAVEVRDEFLSVASHELRTPLTALDLQIDFALRLSRGQTQGGLGAGETLLHQVGVKLERAARQVDRIAALIDNLLDVTLMASGRLVLTQRRVDLTMLVGELVDRLRESSEKQCADIRVDAADTVIGFWDQLLIESVVSNLLSNAIKFGAGRPIVVTVAAVDAKARLTVADHGIGIDPEARDRIFERFGRGVSERHYGGFGLGLWVARQAVEAHGGTIQVSSAFGSGSTFVVELPMPNERDQNRPTGSNDRAPL